MDKNKKIKRRRKIQNKRKLKQDTTFDVIAIQDEINRLQHHKHSNKDQQPQQNDNSPLVSDPAKTPYHENITQQETRLQPTSDLFQPIGGDTNERGHI